MPQAKNIIVKDAANVDKTFTLMAPAAGDDSLATFRLKQGASSVVFPTLSVSTSAKPSSRNLHLKFTIPSAYTDPTTGQPFVKNRAEMNLRLAIPNDFPEAAKGDLVAYIVNIIGHADIRAALTDCVPLT